MKRTAYSIFGLVVWRALKWYLRELLPSRRRIVVSLLSAFAGALAVGVAVRRLVGAGAG